MDVRFFVFYILLVFKYEINAKYQRGSKRTEKHLTKGSYKVGSQCMADGYPGRCTLFRNCPKYSAKIRKGENDFWGKITWCISERYLVCCEEEEADNQIPFSLQMDAPVERESSCTALSRPGVCKEIFRCPELRKQLRDGKVSYRSIRCGRAKSGRYDFVCCPGPVEIIHKPSPLKKTFDKDELTYVEERCGINRYYWADQARKRYERIHGRPPHFMVFDSDAATREKASYMVFMQVKTGSFCGGVLINRQWVLTAAHCLDDIDIQMNEVKVIIGAFNVSVTDKDRTFSIQKIEFHPNYEYPSHYNDLALVKLNRKVTSSRKNGLVPICLPWGREATRKLSDHFVYLMGYGSQEYDGNQRGTLMEAIVKVFRASKCKQSYSSLFVKYRDSYPQGFRSDILLCAGDEKGGIDACQGDSGGPMVYFNLEYRYTLGGIVSDGTGCGNPKYPGIYVKINSPKYLEWIKNVAFTL